MEANGKAKPSDSTAAQEVRERVAPAAAFLGQDEDFCVLAVLAGDLKVVMMPDPFAAERGTEKIPILVPTKDIWPL